MTATLKALAMVFAVIVVGVLIDAGLLFMQASGKRLPFKFNVFPKLGPEF